MRSRAERSALLERLIVAELLARRGEGPLARRHHAWPRGALSAVAGGGPLATTAAAASRDDEGRGTTAREPKEPS